jgi:hypothetical protein
VGGQYHPIHSLGQLLQPSFRKGGIDIGRGCLLHVARVLFTSALRHRLMKNIDSNIKNVRGTTKTG